MSSDDSLTPGQTAASHATQWRFALGAPRLSATIKQAFEDFQVDEDLGFTPTGEGEHLCLHVSKTNLSTTDIARRLSEVVGASDRNIGYAGMKDRRGICTQWFSIPWHEHALERLAASEDDSFRVLGSARNQRKIRIGSHKGNHCRLRLRNCEGTQGAFEERLQSIQATGVPNYFGQQRFGHNMSNLQQVHALFQEDTQNSRQRKGKRYGMLLSAARSYLFNEVLSARIEQNNWNKYVPGDVMGLDGTTRFFVPGPNSPWDAELERRLAEFDIHITGPLAGRRESGDRYTTSGEAADIEEMVLTQFPDLLAGLESRGVVAARRSLRFRPGQLQWQWQDGDLLLQFFLSRGCYATSLLRELCVINEPSK